MSRNTRNTAILAKLQTGPGIDAAPTGASDALLVSNASFKVAYNNVDRTNIKGFFGSDEQLAGTRFVDLSFSVEYSSSGTPGTAPAWGKLLQACSMAEVITASTRVDYTPISTGQKALILDPCLINYGDDRGGIHHDAGDMPDVPKATASDIVRMGRALYVSKSDDPDKAARSTASEAMVKAAQDMAAAKAKAAKAKPAETKPPEA